MNTRLDNFRYDQKNKDGTTTTYDGWTAPIKDGKPDGSNTDLNIGALALAVKQDTGLTLKDFSGKNSKDPINIANQSYIPFSNALYSGNPIVVRVLANGDGGHSVLVTGVDDTGYYIIADPLYDVKTLHDSKYSDTIFGYAWGVFKKGGVSDPYQVPSPYYIDPNDLYNPEINPDQYGLQMLMPDTASTPEPTSLLLLGSGVLGLAGLLRKRLLTRS